MLTGVKAGQWVLIVGLVLSILPGCRKGEQSVNAEASSAVPIPSEEDLREERKALEAQNEEASIRYMHLRQMIGQLKETIAETKDNLNRANAEKEKLLALEADLKKRWEKELEGFGEAHPDGPIIEIYRRMVYKSESLLQENRELKRRLEDVDK